MYKPASLKCRPDVLVFAIMALALALRLWGITWGLPERTDLHPDEHDYVVGHALEVAHQIHLVIHGDEPLTVGTFDPVFLNYPSFLLYLISFFYGLLHAVGLVSQQWGAYLMGRLFSAAFGTATVFVAMLMAREAGARWSGQLLAALWMALLPLHVWDSHVAVTDVTMTFWVACTLWASLRLLRTGRWRDYAMSGIFLGLAVGSKYTAAMVAVAIIAGALLSGRSLANTFPGLVVAAVSSVAACFLVTPYSFIRVGDVLAAMQFEHRHTIGHHFGFSLPADGPQYRRYIYQLAAAWPFSLGVVLYAAALAGTIRAAIRFNRAHAVLLIFFAVFFGVTGHWYFVPLRYYLPLLVIGVVFAGMWMGEWVDSESAWRRRTGVAAVLVTLAYTSVFTFQTTSRYGNDTRVQAEAWIDTALPRGTTLITCGWDRYMALPEDEARIPVLRGDEKAFWDSSKIGGPHVFEISSLHFDRNYRHGNEPYIRKYEALRDPAGSFRLAARFQTSFLNRDFYGRLDPMFRGYFVSPTLEFYERKEK